jgi:N-methylhydantoinase A
VNRFALGVDIGGTFTDVVLCDHREERLYELKVPTTKGHTTHGLLDAIRRVVSLASIGPDSLNGITLGTTTGTNAVLEKKGGEVALITTKGFRHVMDIGRHDIPKDVNMYSWEKPDKLVKPRNIFELDERVDADGRVVRAAQASSIESVLKSIWDKGISTVAVCLLHSYVNPAHERAVIEIASALHPDMMVSCSSEILPVFREYERSMVTVINAYLLPLFRDYEQELRAALDQERVRAPVWVMQSNGGLFSLQSASQAPAKTILSGPVAGVRGAQFVAGLSDYTKLLTLDVGGTSADISLLDAETLSIRRDTEIGGLPLAVPMLDIKTIGAGGGSIVRVSLTGNLTVGPESAGSYPGAVCYGRGGTEPTVTDAHAVLGHLGGTLLHGEMELDAAAAHEAIREKIAVPLGLDVEKAAIGILEIVNENMGGALREVTVERGHDPRDYVLVAFGGAGPLHASSLCRLLNIGKFIAPANSGVLSALGMLTTDLQNDFSRTSILRASLPEPHVLADAYRELEGQANLWLVEEQAQPGESSLYRQADLRYRHQGYEVTVPLPDGELTDKAVAEARLAFDREHERLYGYSMPEGPVEWVTLRVSAVSRRGALGADVLRRQLAEGAERPGAILTSSSSDDREVGGATARSVFDSGSNSFRSRPVWNVAGRPAGTVMTGPGIIELPTSTVLLLAADRAHLDEYGNVVVEVGHNG